MKLHCYRFLFVLLAGTLLPYNVAFANCSCGAGHCQPGAYCLSGSGSSSFLCRKCPDGQEVNDTCDGCKCPSGQHFENNICYPNTRDCKEFDVDVGLDSGAWTCKKEYQTGEATWSSEGGSLWDVSDCACDKYNLDVLADGCKIGVVEHVRLGSGNVQHATDKISYVQHRRYCSKCYPGYVPKIDDAYYQVSTSFWNTTITYENYYQPDNSNQTNWGTYRCEKVSAPFYATGCSINFTESNFNSVLNICRSQCDSNLTITTNGATSADSCAPDSDIKYTDSTGEFTLGPDKCN